MKTCIRCEVSKPSSAFQKDKGKPDGWCSYCKLCRAAILKARSERSRANSLTNMREWRVANADKVKDYKAKSYAEDAERIKAKQRKYTLDKQAEIKVRRRLKYLETKEAMRPRRAETYAAKKKRTPKWNTHEDKLAMIAVYEESARLTKTTGLRHEVDHIIPLQGELVSGLHVPGNLQIMTMKDNRSKGNRVNSLSL